MNEVLLFLIGNREYGLNLPIVKSIHGEDAFAEAYTEKETRASGMQPYTNRTEIRFSNTGFSVPLYNLPAILNEDSLSGMEKGLAVTPTKGKVMLLELGDHSLAMKVDRIEGVVSLESGQIESLSPFFRGASLDCFPQVIRIDGRLILLLDPKGIESLEKRADAERREQYAESPEPDIKDAEAENGIADPAEAVADDSEFETLLVKLRTISDYGSSDVIPADVEDSREAVIVSEDMITDAVLGTDVGDALADNIPITETESPAEDSREILTGLEAGLEELVMPVGPESDLGESPHDLPITIPECPAEEVRDEDPFLSEFHDVLLADNQSLLDTVGADIDAEISLTPFLAEDDNSKKVKEKLIRMVHEKKLSDMIIRVLTRQLEEIVVGEMGKMKDVLLRKLQERGLAYAGKYQRESP